jgi:tol-pal system protein YbgF
MTISSHRFRHAALFAAPLLLVAGVAAAQDARSSGGFLDNPLSRGEPPALDNQAAPASDADLVVRLDRLENQLRQLTGVIEQLQFRNQQLEQQLMRMQGGGPPSAAGAPPPIAPPGVAPAAANGRRSDAFDPTQNPGAVGAPRALGGGVAVVLAEPGRAGEEAAVGAPGGRAAGAPLDLSTLAGNATSETPPLTGAVPPAVNSGPPPARNPSAPGAQVATLPPSSSPNDEYDLAYGYVLRKDYALAEQAFRTFLTKNPSDRLASDARYWLGETLFQRQRYQDAADSFLIVVRNYEHSGKAPDALLRLGQSLAAIGQKEMACASLGEVERKYPRASASVKRGVAQEQKRARC